MIVRKVDRRRFMRHFAFHTLHRLIPFAAPEVPVFDTEVDVFWLERVWPIVQKFDKRRFLYEGRRSFDRSHIRLAQIARAERVRIDIGLFLPNDPNCFAFSEDQITRLASMDFKVFWPGVPVAWKTLTLAKFEADLTSVLELFPNYRLDCRAGPQRPIELNVPFDRKDEAKYYFAKWDPVISKWYVPEFLWNQGLEQFAVKKLAEKPKHLPQASHATSSE